MRSRVVALRACAAVAAVAACTGVPIGGAAEAALPPLIWRDVAALNIHCLTTGDSGVSDGQVARRLCESVRDIAAADAPVPVSMIGPGDPALLAPDSVTLLVHASIERSPVGELLAFSIRPFRNSADPAPLLFAAAPRAVLVAGRDWEDALDAALRVALAETLPWLARPASRSIPR